MKVFPTILLSFLCAVLGQIAFASDALKPADKPNILVILSDDQGFADVGFQGCKDIPTPNSTGWSSRGLESSCTGQECPFTIDEEHSQIAVPHMNKD